MQRSPDFCPAKGLDWRCKRSLRPRVFEKKALKKEKKIEFKYDGGIIEFVNFLNEKKEKLKNKNGNELFKKPIYLEGDKNGINIECSLEWNSGYSEDMHTYTNNIFQKDGGTHLLGFRSSLTRILNKSGSALARNKFVFFLNLGFRYKLKLRKSYFFHRVQII